MTPIRWRCDKCGQTQTFPVRKQPSAWFKCELPMHLDGTVCGGTWSADKDLSPLVENANSQSDSGAE